MSQKSAWLAIALALVLSVGPAAAFAVEGQAPGSDVDPVSPERSLATTQADVVPAISAIDIQGRSVVVVGYNFGAVQGSSVANAYHGGLGDGNTEMVVSVVSWSDTLLQLTLADEPTGIIDIEVVTSAGTTRVGKFVSAGPDVYEDSLALPRDLLPDNYTGLLPMSGVLKGWDDYLYYLREAPTSGINSAFAFHAFDRYNVSGGGWEPLADLPEWLAYCSGAMYEGELVVAGVAYDVATGAPIAEERVYAYDTEQDAWIQLDATGVPLGAGIVNLNGQLMVVGGADSGWAFTNAVYEYDFDAGLGSRVASLARPAFNPQLAVNGGKIFVYSYGTSLAEFNGSGASRFLQVVSDDKVKLLSGVFPSFVAAEASTGMPPRAEMYGTIAAATEGLMLVGPADEEGIADTYILDWSLNGEGFLPYYTRASDARLYGAAACIHDDRLYVAAASEVEPDNQVFRATEVLEPTVERGNYSVWRKGSTKPLAISFTPDISRFDGQVFIDDDELYDDSDFVATSGSTEIEVAVDYLSSLSLGQHDMVVDFDGGGASVTAVFTVEEAADPLDSSTRQGRFRPAMLAKTGDVMLVVPFVIVGLGAMVLAIYLMRRRRRRY